MGSQLLIDAATHGRLDGAYALPVRDQECGRYGACSWHIVATEWNAEDLAAQSIRGIAGETFQVFTPKVRKRIAATAGRPAYTKTSLAFPGYLLVLWDAAAVWQKVKKARGVSHILHRVGDREAPAEVSPIFMLRLLSVASYLGVLEDQRSDPDRRPAVAKGADVQVGGGLLHGIGGICEWSSEQRIALLMRETGFRVVMRRDQVSVL